MPSRITSLLHAAPPSKRTVVFSDLHFFGLGNLELKMVAMCYEMSYGSTQPEPVSYGRQTARANIDNTQHS